MPLDEYVGNGRLVLALGSDEQYVENRFLELINMREAPDIRIFDGFAATETAGAFYEAALRRVTETVHLQTFNVGPMIDQQLTNI